MKIAQIVCTAPPYSGGIGNSAYTFGELLSSRYKVTTFSPRYKKNKTASPAGRQKSIRIPSLLKYGNAAFVPRLLKYLDKYDVIYLHYPFFGGAEVIWFYKTFINRRKKLVIHYHMDVFKLGLAAKILSLPSRIIFNSLFKKADLITTASVDYVRHSQLKKIYFENKEKFREIPFAVDTDKISPSFTPQETPRLLLVGGLDRAHYFKGVDILLQALSLLKDKNWQLDIVGEGELKPFYKEQAQKLGLTERVNFRGELSGKALAQYYRKSDIFVLPSRDKSEAFGIVLLEAMGGGTPVITSDLPGVRSVFTENEQGILARPEDPRDLSEKISYLLDNPRKRKEMGRQARKLVEKKYSLSTLQNNLLSLVKEMKSKSKN